MSDDVQKEIDGLPAAFALEDEKCDVNRFIEWQGQEIRRLKAALAQLRDYDEGGAMGAIIDEALGEPK